MRAVAMAMVFLGVGIGTVIAAESCSHTKDVLGVSRVLIVKPGDYARIGTMQYRGTLPLAPREVVLTFDDGPLAPYTDHVLDALAAQCVKATFFLVGSQARGNPDAVKRIHAEGHTIGTHSEHHPLAFDSMPSGRAQYEIEGGITSVKTALDGTGDVAPFFRVPGLARSSTIEAYVQSRAMVMWSADTVADDWTRISAQDVLHRALARLTAKNGGVLLLHDIQPRTALMLPKLLAELKRRDFKIVHVVADGRVEPRAPLPEVHMAWRKPPPRAWPRVAESEARASAATAVHHSASVPF